METQEVLMLADIIELPLGNDFVVTKRIKVRFNDEIEGKDEKGKNIYKYPQHSFTLKISYEGLTFGDYFRRGGNREEIVAWQNSHRKLGEDWLKANDSKEFTILVKDRGRSSAIPKPDKVKADLRGEISKGTISIEELEAMVREVKTSKKGTVVE